MTFTVEVIRSLGVRASFGRLLMFYEFNQIDGNWSCAGWLGC
jgi:hypothetical protein